MTRIENVSERELLVKLSALSAAVINSSLVQDNGELCVLVDREDPDVLTKLRSFPRKTSELDALIIEIMCQVMGNVVNEANALNWLEYCQISEEAALKIGARLAAKIPTLTVASREKALTLARQSREIIADARERELQEAEKRKYFWEVVLSVMIVAFGILILSFA